MGYKSHIEWTESTWNPVTGCSKISDGCKNCYAERLARRLRAMGVKKYRDGFKVTLHEDSLLEPFNWKKSRMVFVCSMSDLLHKEVPDEYIQKIFRVMNKAENHIFQILTKRAHRLHEINRIVEWTPNIWAGTTIESEKYVERADFLRNIDAKVKFISMEPLLSDIAELNLFNIDWVIVGGESGPGARPMNPAWVKHIKDHCLIQDVPFFFKQWGGTNKKKAGRLLDGRLYSEFPRVQPV